MELIGKGKTGKSKDKLYRYQFEKKSLILYLTVFKGKEAFRLIYPSMKIELFTQLIVKRQGTLTETRM